MTIPRDGETHPCGGLVATQPFTVTEVDTIESEYHWNNGEPYGMLPGSLLGSIYRAKRWQQEQAAREEFFR